MSLHTFLRGKAVGLLTAAGIAALACAGVVANSASAAASSSSTVVVAETTAPNTLDPQATDVLANRYAWDLTYQCLLTTSNTGAIQPLLATSYTESHNGLSYVFKLRHGVTFSNGDAMTSADVVFTFDRLFKTGSPSLRALFNNYKSVSAKGRYTVKFALTARNAGFLATMASPMAYGCSIMDKKAVAAGNAATHMVGTGPWEQTGYAPNSKLTMTRFNGYWGTKTAAKNLDILYVPDSTTQLADLKSGSVDLIFPSQPSVAALKSDHSVKVGEVPGDFTVFLMLNQNKPPFNNLDVRRAVSVALNRASLAKVSYDGSATASAYVPPSYAWAKPLSALPYQTYNVAEAKKLLSEGGYPNGFSTTLEYITSYDWATNTLLSQMQAQLAAVGIQVTLDPLQVAAWVQQAITGGQYQMSWNAQPYYSNPFQYVAVPAYRIGNGIGTVPTAMQQLTTKALAASSTKAFYSGINAIQNYEASQGYPTLPLLVLKQFVAYRSDLTNVHYPATGDTTFLASVGKRS